MGDGGRFLSCLSIPFIYLDLSGSFSQEPAWGNSRKQGQTGCVGGVRFDEIQRDIVLIAGVMVGQPVRHCNRFPIFVRVFERG